MCQAQPWLPIPQEACHPRIEHLRRRLLRPLAWGEQSCIGFLARPPVFDGFTAVRYALVHRAEIETGCALANLKRQPPFPEFRREPSILLSCVSSHCKVHLERGQRQAAARRNRRRLPRWELEEVQGQGRQNYSTPAARSNSLLSSPGVARVQWSPVPFGHNHMPDAGLRWIVSIAAVFDGNLKASVRAAMAAAQAELQGEKLGFWRLLVKNDNNP